MLEIKGGAFLTDWSRDGRFLTYYKRDPESQYDIWVLPLEGDRKAYPFLKTNADETFSQFSPDGKEVYYLEGGRINVVTVESRAVRPLNASAELDVDFSHEKLAVFNEAWSYLRDNFFDATMHGANWGALHEVYADRVSNATTPDEMRRLMNLMIGELNASHLGIGGPPSQPPSTGRLGLSFDRGEYERDGKLRITDVVALGPAALSGMISVGFLGFIGFFATCATFAGWILSSFFRPLDE